MRKPRQLADPNAKEADTEDSLVADAPMGSGARPMPTTTPAQAETGPLGPAELELLDQAFERRRSIARAVTLARANGFGLLATALLALPFAPFQPSLLLVTLVLGSSALVELRGARMLQRLDLRAPKWLAWNQLALLLAVALYCAFAIFSGLQSSSPLGDLGGAYPELAGQMNDLSQNLGGGNDLADHTYRVAVVGFYLALLVGSGLYQGLCAYFY